MTFIQIILLTLLLGLLVKVVTDRIEKRTNPDNYKSLFDGRIRQKFQNEEK